MDSNKCPACNVTLENDKTLRNHRCRIVTNAISGACCNFENDILSNSFESQVSRMDVFLGQHIDRRFETRNNHFPVGQDRSISKISEVISKNANESFENPDFFKALCELDPFFDSNFKQQSTVEECRSEQTIPRCEHPLPSFAPSIPHKNFYEYPTNSTYDCCVEHGILNQVSCDIHFHNSRFERYSEGSRSEQNISKNHQPIHSYTFPGPYDKNFYDIPPYLMYSIQDRLEDIIPNDRRLIETATENSPHSDMISSVSLDKHSERRKNNLDRSISIVLPNDSTCVSNSAVDDRLIRENKKLQMNLLDSVLKDISFEENESHNRANSRSSDDKPFKCRICCYGLTTKGNLKRHFINIHKLEESQWRIMIDSESLDNKPFKCQICGKRVSSKQNLHNHLRTIHKIESNFKC
ncbi:hypothetical protein NPIL_283381 [Nephila pilipes]|uniref:C2H2-type domain-containing protein n=1 Tax=Nephila pilipes TaxID=299642 RepID=A0A8X6NUG1_NEPPI|nr:hypothetical protein NPIL_283381 [Nephila pilipes]